jgi:3-isopropylmalate dehydrogenase
MKGLDDDTMTNPLRLAVVPGDGIGVETTREAVRVLERLAKDGALSVSMTHFPWSADHYLATGVSLPDGAFETLATDFDAVLVGAFGDPRIPDMRHAKDILLGMRFRMDLYVNYRPVKCLDDRLSPLKKWKAEDIDFVVFRENTEGSYVGMGGIFKKGTPDELAIEEDLSTRKGVERICRHAFEYARTFEKPKRLARKPRVLMADKHNVHRFGGDLWHRVYLEVAEGYPDCDASHMFVDALTMQMVKNPASLDVVVTNNMFGDIVTDLGAMLQGGLGVAASGNIHPGKTSLFEPIHGSAPYMAGRNVANPIGSILTVEMLLRTLGHGAAASRVENAVVETIRRGETTADLGGALSTSQAGDAVLHHLES